MTDGVCKPSCAGSDLSKSTMNALSRREEEALEKSLKQQAIKECDAFLKGFVFVFSCFHCADRAEQWMYRIR